MAMLHRSDLLPRRRVRDSRIRAPARNPSTHRCLQILRPSHGNSGCVVLSIEDCRAKMRLCLDALEGALADTDYLVANTFGIADIMTGYTLALASHRGMVPDDYPNSEAYVGRLRERLGFRAASAAG